jgi:fibronectin type 3 domain-containing protein
MELEWAQNPERDVLGYRVYRLGLSSKTRVCPASTAGTDAVITKTTCTDSAPNTLGLYQVVAVDRPTLGNPASGTREGDTTNFVATNLGTRPAAPAGLTASIVDGRVRLQWSGLAVPPLFYRIYRNGTRIDRTATPEPFYVDGEPFDGVARTYQVSAVGLTFNESTLSAAVTIG